MRVGALSFASCAWVSLLAVPFAQNGPAPLPDAATVMQGLRASARFDYEILEQFTYLEERRDVKLSKLGKVTVGPLRTFEVHPSSQPGKTWKRLIAVDGTPIGAAEVARADAEHERNEREAAEKRRNETPAQRATREAEEAREKQERDAVVRDAFAVYTPTVLGRETIHGAPVIAVDIHPRPDAQVETREGRWMKQFEGRLWVAEPGYQLAALELRAIDDVSIGWGIVGRVHEGSRFSFTRRKVQDAWLPAEVVFEASGRTLLFRKFQIRTVTTYSNYKRK
jgi:hypothetical protein